MGYKIGCRRVPDLLLRGEITPARLPFHRKVRHPCGPFWKSSKHHGDTQRKLNQKGNGNDDLTKVAACNFGTELRAMAERGERQGDGKRSHAATVSTLSDLGVTKTQSSRWAAPLNESMPSDGDKTKIEEQREFVRWWRETVRRPGKPIVPTEQQ
jgi:hypothetical protein